MVMKNFKLKNKIFDNIKTFENTIIINKKKEKILHLKVLEYFLRVSIKNLEKAIDVYKILINKTELWEGKQPIDFNFKDWYELKKVNGHITRYYNKLKEIKKKTEGVKND